MAHITLPDGLPGITGSMAYRPETGKLLRELAEVLLRGPNSLTSAEREIIATYTSSRNDCYFCQTSHGAAAAHHLGGNLELVDQVKRDFETAPISHKLKRFLPSRDTFKRVGRT
jgi:AhpD family alkylhydroperoxidase